MTVMVMVVMAGGAWKLMSSDETDQNRPRVLLYSWFLSQPPTDPEGGSNATGSYATNTLKMLMRPTSPSPVQQEGHTSQSSLVPP